jgi:fatty acid desaturase
MFTFVCLALVVFVLGFFGAMNHLSCKDMAASQPKKWELMDSLTVVYAIVVVLPFFYILFFVIGGAPALGGIAALVSIPVFFFVHNLYEKWVKYEKERSEREYKRMWEEIGKEVKGKMQ